LRARKSELDVFLNYCGHWISPCTHTTSISQTCGFIKRKVYQVVPTVYQVVPQVDQRTGGT
jgi:hypothetical protein